MGAEPSIPTDPSRKLEVIGAGFSRTGTVSTSMALERLLEGPVMHGGSQMLGREDSYNRLWAQVFDAKLKGDQQRCLKLLRDATAGFVAMTDVPATCLITELQELYPDAKVLLVTRDAEKWWASINVVNDAVPWWLGYLLAPCPGWRWFTHLIECYKAADSQRLDPVFDPTLLERHNQWVRMNTPPEKLFEVDLKDGWEPFCKVFGKPVPKEPFPKANDADAIKELSQKIFVRAVLTWVSILFCVAALGFVGLSGFRDS